jgi:hypothetical protein
MMEGDDDGGRDLDEDIPDADLEGGFGYDGVSDDDEDDEEEEEEEEDDDEEEEEEESGEEDGLTREEVQERRRELERIRAIEERRREIMIEAASQNARESREFLDFDEEELSEEERSQLLQEEDLIHESAHPVVEVEVEVGTDMDMDADLDDDIPEAESGVYEHTDSEAELDSEEDTRDLSYARSSRVLHRRTSHRRSEAPRSSIDISGLLSGNESSMMDSSPHMRIGNY